VGVPGELVVGGVGLARGYLGLAELTADRFLPDPFAPDPGARMYRTGDLARWRADGQIELVGRLDHQVKVRGHRVEPGEVEAVLERHPEIRQAAVVAHEDGPEEIRLAAYVVGEEGAVPPAVELRRWLGQVLPEPMLPADWTVLPALPLTPSGKVDRRALPAPERGGAEPAAFVAPQTPVELVLADLWSDVLGLERIGRDDDFFALGGHSLLATQVASRIRATLEVELSLQRIFELPTIRLLATDLLADDADRHRVERTAELVLALAELSDEEVEERLTRRAASGAEG
jgi:hypothetical protein